MLDFTFAIVLVGAGLILLAVFTSVIAFRFGAPLLLVFLGLGLLVGEDGIGLPFNDTSLAYFVGSLALAVILFDSGFGTSLATFRAAAAPAVTLATLGVVLTAGLVGAGAHFIFGLPWLEAFLIGALISSTDAAAVFFLLRVGGVHIRERVKATLEVESGANDPMAIFLTVTLLELIVAQQQAGSFGAYVFFAFVRQMGLGLALGLAGGMMIVHGAKWIRLEPGLYPIAVVAAALVVFGAIGMIGGSGFLAVYVAGLYAGNRSIPSVLTLRRFQDATTWLAQIIMFLVLGLLATPSQFANVALQAIGLALFLTFIGRPLAVWLCLLPFRFQPNETAFISWVGLRGAVSILLAILPMAAGLPSGQAYFNVVFIIVLTSLLLQGWTINPTARRLGLTIPPTIGPVDKIELELPGAAADHELVAYRVVAGSPVASGERIPRWARPSLVVRDGQSMRYQHAGRLQPGDRVYLFTLPRYLRLLDRLFASPAPIGEEDEDLFGEFVIGAKVTLGDLAKSYEIGAHGLDLNKTAAEFIEGRLGGRIEVGDRTTCGSIELIVREIDDMGKVQSVGISVQPQLDRSTQIPLFLNAREIMDRLRSFLRSNQP